jgi:hypothetical protein
MTANEDLKEAKYDRLKEIVNKDNEAFKKLYDSAIRSKEYSEKNKYNVSRLALLVIEIKEQRDKEMTDSKTLELPKHLRPLREWTDRNGKEYHV